MTELTGFRASTERMPDDSQGMDSTRKGGAVPARPESRYSPLDRRGFAAIGLMRPKYPENVGAVMRAAFCFDVAMVAVQGDRTRVRTRSDTYKAWRHIPVVRGNSLQELIPYDAVPVAVDLVDGAVELQAFSHPQRAFYVFGPEDGTLGNATLNWCHARVMIPTRTCMNLAATVNVVLYDRMAKQGRAR